MNETYVNIFFISFYFNTMSIHLHLNKDFDNDGLQTINLSRSIKADTLRLKGYSLTFDGAGPAQSAAWAALSIHIPWLSHGVYDTVLGNSHTLTIPLEHRSDAAAGAELVVPTGFVAVDMALVSPGIIPQHFHVNVTHKSSGDGADLDGVNADLHLWFEYTASQFF